MLKNPPHVYQFKITLEGIRPAIWRRIQIPDTYTFGDFHCAIQQAMGWEECHLHQFMIKNPKTGEEERIASADVLEDDCVVEEEENLISSYFSLENKRALYEYDFGDGWEHKILLEKILPLDPDKTYPICLAGERACPPEDCGGIWGYENILEVLSDPNHPNREERLEWIGGDFDPEAFDPESVFASDDA